MRSLFVIDPLPSLQPHHDSTFAVMRECTDRGEPVWWCTPDDLSALDGRPRARARAARVLHAAPWFEQGPPQPLDLAEVDVVWMRKDPPFDLAYVFTTWILDMVPPHVLVVNDPVGLKVFNEKLWAMHFPELHPHSLLSKDLDEILDFVGSLPGRCVLKPWNGMGGRGVLVTHRQDRNLRSMIELLSNQGRDHVIAQAYLEGIAEGDKRILLFEGEPVGALLRVPGAEDHRGNMAAGATIRATTLTEAERRVCEVLGAPLRDNGQVFVGIDTIGGVLTEINVTSPTGIQEVDRLDGVCLEADLVDRVEARLGRLRSSP